MKKNNQKKDLKIVLNKVSKILKI